jgi:hypothetical protein
MERTRDQQKFCNALLGLAENYNRKLSEHGIELYFRALENFDIEEIIRAMTEHLREGEFFPTPAAIIKRIDGGVKNAGDYAVEQWEAVLDQLSKCGPHQKPNLSPGTFATVNAIGGWKMLNECDFRELLQKRKEFLDVYAVKYKNHEKQKLQIERQKQQQIGQGVTK